jgi:hypothetical protein
MKTRAYLKNLNRLATTHRQQGRLMTQPPQSNQERVDLLVQLQQEVTELVLRQSRVQQEYNKVDLLRDAHLGKELATHLGEFEHAITLLRKEISLLEQPQQQKLLSPKVTRRGAKEWQEKSRVDTGRPEVPPQWPRKPDFSALHRARPIPQEPRESLERQEPPQHQRPPDFSALHQAHTPSHPSQALDQVQAAPLQPSSKDFFVGGLMRFGYQRHDAEQYLLRYGEEGAWRALCMLVIKTFEERHGISATQVQNIIQRQGVEGALKYLDDLERRRGGEMLRQ